MLMKMFLIPGWLCCASIAFAGPMDPIISSASVSETVPGQSTATLQMNISTIKAIQLISVSTDVARSVEIHSVKLVRGKMVPHIVSSFKLPAHRTVDFGSKNLFLMMTGINKTLNAGDNIPLTVTYAFADKKRHSLTTVAIVRKAELSYKHYEENRVYEHR